jgi:hypothetical protein
MPGSVRSPGGLRRRSRRSYQRPDRPDPDLTAKEMFGGLAFLICGHMAISASGQGGVLVHVDPGRSGDLVATTRAATAVMQGREMPGRLRVNPEDLASDDDLSGWVEIGVGHARSLPPKQPAKNKPKKDPPSRWVTTLVRSLSAPTARPPMWRITLLAW